MGSRTRIESHALANLSRHCHSASHTPELSVVSIVDMLNLANLIGDRTFEYLVPLSMVGLIFLVLTLICSALIRLLERTLPKNGIALK